MAECPLNSIKTLLRYSCLEMVKLCRGFILLINIYFNAYSIYIIIYASICLVKLKFRYALWKNAPASNGDILQLRKEYPLPGEMCPCTIKRGHSSTQKEYPLPGEMCPRTIKRGHSSMQKEYPLLGEVCPRTFKSNNSAHCIFSRSVCILSVFSCR